jgi:starch synthase
MSSSAEAVPGLKVLLVGSECAPFAKTGGLADVVGSLPRALRRRGVDARVVMPLYRGIPWDGLEVLEGVLSVPVARGMEHGRVRLGSLPRSDVPVYFLEHHHYYDREHLYGSPTDAYPDNIERFTFLSRGALQLCKALAWYPDVVHANDWQTALVPVYVDTVEWAQPLHGAASIYTIHNLAYQGVADREALLITGLGPEHDNSNEFEHFGTLNLTKAALAHATLVTTVSPTYAREIQTPEYGYGLDGVLRARSGDLFGLVNGIDPEEWSPAVDPHIPARFDARDIGGKAVCKAALQEEAGLPVRPEVPLFGLVARLVPQKGIDVLAYALDRILDLDLQLVLLGTGDPEAESFFARVSDERPDRFRAWLHFSDPRAHRIEAGSDFFLMPSRFEPCGLNQIYSLAYGTLPIVRATGGLADTVRSYSEASGTGTGFAFHDLTPGSIFDTVGWAVSTWYQRPHHIEGMRREAMAEDFSWRHVAEDYERVYRLAYRRRRGHAFPPREAEAAPARPAGRVRGRALPPGRRTVRGLPTERPAPGAGPAKSARNTARPRTAAKAKSRRR